MSSSRYSNNTIATIATPITHNEEDFFPSTSRTVSKRVQKKQKQEQSFQMKHIQSQKEEVQRIENARIEAQRLEDEETQRLKEAEEARLLKEAEDEELLSLLPSHLKKTISNKAFLSKATKVVPQSVVLPRQLFFEECTTPNDHTTRALTARDHIGSETFSGPIHIVPCKGAYEPVRLGGRNITFTKEQFAKSSDFQNEVKRFWMKKIPQSFISVKVSPEDTNLIVIAYPFKTKI